ncbi:MAG: DUF3187 family protein [Thermodesulfovibrionales bacterium]
MKKIIIFLAMLLIFFLHSSASYGFDGPLQVRNQFPLLLYLNTPYLESALVENSFSASLSYSSINLVESSSEWDIGLDMEITELNLRFRKSIKDFIELGVEVPIFSFNSGFMDGFLNSYHDAFGFPDYGRSNRPDNEFLYEVRRNEKLVVKGKNGHIGIGDIRLTFKKPLLNSDPAISIKGDIDLPTGDAKAGYGNGSIDAGISVLMDKKLSEYFKSYLNIGAVFPGNLRGHEEINLREFFYGGAAIEASFWKNISLIGQVLVQGSPFPKTDISSIDKAAVLLSLGGRYSSGNNNFEFSLTEDPNTSGAPDFTLNFSFKRIF